jgi:dolichol-phosphate mannosyltransferase
MSSLISIILPIFNEQENIPAIYHELSRVIDGLPKSYTHEIIFINDGSSDQSWQIIQQHALQDHHIRGLSFSRNFGHQVALSAGYDYARGDIIITLDADMQHPPHIIPEMIRKWEQGAHIVYARRSARDDDMFLKKITASYFYRFFEWIAEIKIPHNVADFRLIDKKVLHEIRRFKDHSPFLRGMISWTGFKSDFVDFQCSERLHGTAGYTWFKMVKLALDGIIGFSTLPLKAAGVIGCVMISAGSVSLGYIFLKTLMGYHYPLLNWFIILNFLFLGMLFVFVWFLGEYIGRMYAQQRGRPLYIVDQELQQNQVQIHPRYASSDNIKQNE